MLSGVMPLRWIRSTDDGAPELATGEPASQGAASGAKTTTSSVTIRDNTLDNIHPVQCVQSAHETSQFGRFGPQQKHLHGPSKVEGLVGETTPVEVRVLSGALGNPESPASGVRQLIGTRGGVLRWIARVFGLDRWLKAISA